MMKASLFHRLEQMARVIRSMMRLSFSFWFDVLFANVRENDRPFGGVQLVLCGDFLQLPPVEDKHQVFPGMRLEFFHSSSRLYILC
jgi:hypothetical protein